MESAEKSYVVVVQCDKVVHDVCPGFLCEHAFTARIGGFARYPAVQKMRFLSISCGGCPGTAVLRKLTNLKHNFKKREQLEPGVAVVHLSSCITRDNHHSPRCPHIDYIKAQIARAEMDCVEDTRISGLAEKRRREGVYQSPPPC